MIFSTDVHVLYVIFVTKPSNVSSLSEKIPKQWFLSCICEGLQKFYLENVKGLENVSGQPDEKYYILCPCLVYCNKNVIVYFCLQYSYIYNLRKIMSLITAVNQSVCITMISYISWYQIIILHKLISFIVIYNFKQLSRTYLRSYLLCSHILAFASEDYISAICILVMSFLRQNQIQIGVTTYVKSAICKF